MEPTLNKANIPLVHNFLGFQKGKPQAQLQFHLQLKNADPVDNDIVSNIIYYCTNDYTLTALENSETLVHQLVNITKILLESKKFPFAYSPTIEPLGKLIFDIRMPLVEGAEHQYFSVITDILSILINNNDTEIKLKQLAKNLNILASLHAPRGLNTLPLLEAAYAMGLPVYRVQGNVYQFGQGNKQHWFNSSCSDLTPNLATSTSQNKLVCKNILIRSGLPVAKGWQIHSKEHALKSAQQLGYPVVIKPTHLDRGEGVSSLIDDGTVLVNAYNNAKKLSNDLMIEAFIPGNDYRIHVLKSKTYRVRSRTPGGVTGNGNSTIYELITQLNQDPRRGATNDKKELVRIDLDDEAAYMLARQGLSKNDIPVNGHYVQLRTTANVSTGGVSSEVPIEIVHPDNIAVAERAVSLLNLDIAAVDFITPDITKSWLDQGGGICEINAIPQFGGDAPKRILEEYFPHGGHIPIGLIIGPNPISYLQPVSSELLLQGKKLAYVDSESNLTIANQRIAISCENTTFHQGRNLVTQRDVDAIVLKADNSLLTNGHFSNKYSFILITEWPLQEHSLPLFHELSTMSDTLLSFNNTNTPTTPQKNNKQNIKQINVDDLNLYIKQLIFQNTEHPPE